MFDDGMSMMNLNDLEGEGCGPFEILSQHTSRGTDKNHEISSEWPTFRREKNQSPPELKPNLLALYQCA